MRFFVNAIDYLHLILRSVPAQTGRVSQDARRACSSISKIRAITDAMGPLSRDAGEGFMMVFSPAVRSRH